MHDRQPCVCNACGSYPRMEATLNLACNMSCQHDKTRTGLLRSSKCDAWYFHRAHRFIPTITGCQIIGCIFFYCFFADYCSLNGLKQQNQGIASMRDKLGNNMPMCTFILCRRLNLTPKTKTSDFDYFSHVKLAMPFSCGRNVACKVSLV
jgi:hypothetical protein